jgi:hypothetical protein
MDIVVIFNGLGNQMSQYAFYLSKKSINPATYYIDFCTDHNGAELNKVFNIPYKQTSFQKRLFIIFRILVVKKIKIFKPLQALLNSFNYNIIEENFNYIFNRNYLSPAKNITFYFGGWPSEKYFLNVRDEILKEFTFTKPTDVENTLHVAGITNSNSVAIHVRRGDYLNANNLELFGKVCTKAYYEKAIATIKAKVENPHFFVFSNDIDWVEANLKMENCTYVTCNSGTKSWIDMYLMSICKHNIVANSTFSWWGAWLNTNPDKIVISPSRYLNNDEYTDFYPETWIRLADY